MANSKLQTASVLAFERKLDPSDGLFSAGRWQEQDKAAQWPAIEVNEKSVRGTISNRLKTKDQDPAKLDASIQNPNLQTVDAAALPLDADTLQVRFTLRVLGGAGSPSACNSHAYQSALQSTVQAYAQDTGFGELALRYASNLANARFLWRNRLGAEQVAVQVSQISDGEAVQSWSFDALKHDLRAFEKGQTELDGLASVIESGLAGDRHVLLDIRCFARVGDGQEVYPSQELILDKAKSNKSRTLYTVNGAAAMHSQKIGNAIRAIDTWYEGAETLGPIAVEPYGSVTTQGRAYRQPKSKQDFYSLLDKWVLTGEAPDKDQQHFVMATLIRGGVFGEKAD